MADEDYDDINAGEEFGDTIDVLAEEEELDTSIPEGATREVAKESRALQFLNTHHPECRLDYIEEVQQKLPLSAYPPDSGSDTQHRSVPYLTLFEKTKIIGFRANQISQGARVLIQVPPHMTDVIEIAKKELEEKRLPYILKRPMPDGTFEYVRLADLLVL